MKTDPNHNHFQFKIMKVTLYTDDKSTRYFYSLKSINESCFILNSSIRILIHVNKNSRCLEQYRIKYVIQTITIYTSM